MKKIITAIGNEILNKKLKKENDFEVIIEDIQYKEGIIEYLEKENNIDILIISELLPGNIELKELIEKIKNINSNIEIIIFLENKNTELENYLYAKGIYNIFYNNQIEIEEIIKIINNKNIEINNELKEIKQMLLEKQKNKVNNKKIILNKLINIFNKKQKYDLKEEKIISVTGTNGVGKSIFTINLANSLSNSKNKILIIDFDILNNSLHTILGIKKYSKKIQSKIKNNNLLKEIKIEELIIKINSKIDLVSGINLLFDSKYKISSEKVKNILSKLKEKYEIIIIDTSSECFFDYTIYINNWEIPQENINILFNKYNENSIEISILKKIFSGFNILGKLSFNPQYNLIINKNNINKLNIILKNEYLKINKNLIKINKKGEF